MILIFKRKKNRIISRLIALVLVFSISIMSKDCHEFYNMENTRVYASEQAHNLALDSTVSCSSNMSDAITNLYQINDGNLTSETTRLTTKDVSVQYVGDDYFQFNWDSAVSINKVVISSWYCYGQAPSSWKITVLKEGSNHWQEIGILENVDWGEATEIQSKSMIFPKQDQVKSLRVNILANNDSWLKYVIKEIEIYNDTNVLYGDANQDQVVDVCDFVRTRKYLAQSNDDIGLTEADLNRDQSIDKNDLLAIRELLVGKESMIPAKDGYDLDWSDEFDGNDLDHEKWLAEYFPHATHGKEGKNAKYEVKNGTLSMILDRDTKSFSHDNDDGMKVSSIQTYEKDYLHPVATQVSGKHVETFDGYRTKYGYFEMRCKAPSCGGGGAIAWWLIGVEDDGKMTVDEDGNEQWVTNHCGEIDIIENIIDQPNFQRFNVISHTDDSLTSTQLRQTIDGDFVNEWHTYAFDWTPEYMDFYIDGVLYKHVDQSVQYEMCVIISMYMVTNPESVPNYSWGYANDVFPKTWEIDYMRVYKKK